MADIAGVILFEPMSRVGGGRVLVLQRQNGSWDLPKGHVDDREPLKITALRETFEETGIRPRLTGGFDSITYAGNTIWIFNARADTTRVHLSEEHKQFKWTAPENAIQMLFKPLAKLVRKMLPIKEEMSYPRRTPLLANPLEVTRSADSHRAKADEALRSR